MKKRVYEYFNVADHVTFNIQLLNWSSRFSNFCFMDSNSQSDELGSVQKLVAAGTRASLQCQAGTALEQLTEFSSVEQDWIFGHLGYNLKNEIESLSSDKTDFVGFPDLYFFVPEIIIEITANQIRIGSVTNSPAVVYEEIRSQDTKLPPMAASPIHTQARMSRSDYLVAIKEIQEELLKGACYEINYCQEFFATDAIIHPVSLFEQLNENLKQPFSVYYRLDHLHALSASPERFIVKKDGFLWSQPMKGTAPRIPQDTDADEAVKLRLMNDPKERAENIMVVDLVRNDLSKISVPGSVTVPDLCKVVSFPNVHQMISTVKSIPVEGLRIGSLMKACFPMGSMTGAPKKRVMELIEQYEVSNRGLFSGSIGYIKPNGEFDFNVMIRSVFYNERTHYLSFHTGSGITYYANAAKEYEECLLKASAIKKVLTEVSTSK